MHLDQDLGNRDFDLLPNVLLLLLTINEHSELPDFSRSELILK
jgi:hypothetical protein